MAITLNPGFALMLGAALAFVAPRPARAGAMIACALLCLILIFAPRFGSVGAFAQVGLTITPLRLDPLAQIFGVGFSLVSVILALFSASRDNRTEDAALMALGGGAMAAVFAGDMVSFAAGAQFAALSGAVLVFRGPGPGAVSAGVRYLSWQAAAGALLTAGIGLTWARTGAIAFDRMSPGTLDGALMFAGMAIMAGAPLAHVWLKDAVKRTSALGGAALCAFSVRLGAYALARAFPGEPALTYLGVVAAVGGVVMAGLSRDVREAGAYGLVSQSGAVIAAIGAGTPFALASAAALSFAGLLHTVLAMLAIGLACERAGSGREAKLGALAQSMPATALLASVAALSVMGAPGFIGYAAATINADALAQQDRPLVWLALMAAGAGGVMHFGGRLPYVVFFGADRGARGADGPFPAHLAMLLAAFFCIAIGVFPSWLYALLPAQIYFHPYDWDHLIGQGQLVCFAGLVFAAAAYLKWLPPDRGEDLVDVDWLWRRFASPLGAGLRTGFEAAYARTRAAGDWAAPLYAQALGALAREGDRPAAPDAAGLVWAMVVLLAAMMFLFALQA